MNEIEEDLKETIKIKKINKIKWYKDKLTKEEYDTRREIKELERLKILKINGNIFKGYTSYSSFITNKELKEMFQRLTVEEQREKFKKYTLIELKLNRTKKGIKVKIKYKNITNRSIKSIKKTLVNIHYFKLYKKIKNVCDEYNQTNKKGGKEWI